MQNKGKTRALKWQAKHANMATGGHKEDKKGQKEGMICFTPGWHQQCLNHLAAIPRKTQDKTRPKEKKERLMLTAQQTMSDWDKLRWKEKHFSKRLSLTNFSRAKYRVVFFLLVTPKKVLNMELVPPNRKKCPSTLVPPKTHKQKKIPAQSSKSFIHIHEILQQ